MQPVNYFAYGSNLDAEQMRARCPSARTGFRARLFHHRLEFTHFSRRWGGGAADIVRFSDQLVWGMVYELDDADLPVLDRYESGYQRILIEVIDDAGQERQALSYSVLYKANFLPHPRYLNKMLTWGRRWEFPDDYLEGIGATTSDRLRLGTERDEQGSPA